MQKQILLSGTFCTAAVALAFAVIGSSPVDAQRPGEVYTASGCGMFDGKLCKTVKTTTCEGNTCTTETEYYYYTRPLTE